MIEVLMSGVLWSRREVLAGASAAALGVSGPSVSMPAMAGGWRPEDFDAEVATAWFDLALTLTRATPGFSPPVASRAFGYAGLTLYV